MPPPKLDADGDGLVLGEELLLGRIPFASDLDLKRRMRAQVPDPFGARSPDGADDRLAGVGS
jgi:hypothetical protein